MLELMYSQQVEVPEELLDQLGADQLPELGGFRDQNREKMEVYSIYRTGFSRPMSHRAYRLWHLRSLRRLLAAFRNPLRQKRRGMSEF